MSDPEEVETPELERARRVEAFAARSGRHRRWAEAFIGNDDPLFAIACELVDHEARLDGLAETVLRLEQRVAAQRDINERLLRGER